MSEPVVQSLLRLPISLKTKIEQAAKESNRSINSEMVARLEQTFLDVQNERQQLSEDLKEAQALLNGLRRLYAEHFPNILDNSK